MPTFLELMLSSYQRLLGKPLVGGEKPNKQDVATWLYHDAPFCLLAHDTQPSPCFVYANISAQQCFEYDWDELIGMPSCLTAETPNREERQALIERVIRDGYATGYRGLRIAKSGRRFWIENVTMWNVYDMQNNYCGQAAAYDFWRNL